MDQILRVRLYQPSAHFRVPFTFQRRFTYPLPPLSTVKGLLCNLLGIKSDASEEYHELFSSLSLAVYGRFGSITTDYVWLRNLDEKQHIKRFNSAENRTLDFMPQHPGGQIPVKVDVLTDNQVILYISSKNINKIEAAFKCPENRNDVVSLGRAEDSIIIEETALIAPQECRKRKCPMFTWLPDSESVDTTLLPDSTKERYSEFFRTAPGNVIKLPLFYSITEKNERVFDKFATVKLYEGGLFDEKAQFWNDDDNQIPLIFCKVRL